MIPATNAYVISRPYDRTKTDISCARMNKNAMCPPYVNHNELFVPGIRIPDTKHAIQEISSQLQSLEPLDVYVYKRKGAYLVIRLHIVWCVRGCVRVCV